MWLARGRQEISIEKWLGQQSFGKLRMRWKDKNYD
jgi:hypothetical protein